MADAASCCAACLLSARIPYLIPHYRTPPPHAQLLDTSEPFGPYKVLQETYLPKVGV